HGGRRGHPWARAFRSRCARSALAPSRLLPVVKHACRLGQPPRGLERCPRRRRGACGSFCCSAPKCATGNRADISLPATGLARNCQSAQLLGIAAGAAGTISVRANRKSLAPVSSRGHTARGGSWMALNQVTLDDKYDLAKSRIFVTGFQALVRLCLMQKERDRRAGLNTAGYVTGYRGSPLGTLDQQFIRAQR